MPLRLWAACHGTQGVPGLVTQADRGAPCRSAEGVQGSPWCKGPALGPGPPPPFANPKPGPGWSFHLGEPQVWPALRGLGDPELVGMEGRADLRDLAWTTLQPEGWGPDGGVQA